MAAIKVGDKVPEATFKYVPYTPELDDGVSHLCSNLISQIAELIIFNFWLLISLLVEFVRLFDMVLNLKRPENKFSNFSHDFVHERVEGKEGRSLLCSQSFHRAFVIFA